jgi:hypothetical protein
MNNKPNRSPSRVVFARISPALGEALDRYIDSLRPRPTMTSVLEVMVEDYLKSKGFWPPQEPVEETK